MTAINSIGSTTSTGAAYRAADDGPKNEGTKKAGHHGHHGGHHRAEAAVPTTTPTVPAGPPTSTSSIVDVTV